MGNYIWPILKRKRMITGLSAEEVFKEVMVKMGKIVLPSSKEDNMFGHIDFFVDGEGYDVKGEKRMDRKVNDDDDTIWIESVNVRGDKGWLFGKAKYIAFLVKNEFWIINREDLVTYIEKEITCQKVFPIKRYKKWYSREGRKDAITYVYPRDIQKLVKEKIII